MFSLKKKKKTSSNQCTKRKRKKKSLSIPSQSPQTPPPRLPTNHSTSSLSSLTLPPSQLPSRSPLTTLLQPFQPSTFISGKTPPSTAAIPDQSAVNPFPSTTTSSCYPSLPQHSPISNQRRLLHNPRCNILNNNKTTTPLPHINAPQPPPHQIRLVLCSHHHPRAASPTSTLPPTIVVAIFPSQ